VVGRPFTQWMSSDSGPSPVITNSTVMGFAEGEEETVGEDEEGVPVSRVRPTDVGERLGQGAGRQPQRLRREPAVGLDSPP